MGTDSLKDDFVDLKAEKLCGAMDGERLPATRLEHVQKALANIHQKYGHHLLKLKPWREFCSIGMPESRKDLSKRLGTNLAEYQINYITIFAISMFISIVVCPWCLLVLTLVSATWIALVRKAEDPEWGLSISGVKLTKTQQYMALGTISFAVLLAVLGHVFFPTFIVCSAFAVVHSMAHPVAQGDTVFEDTI